MTLKKFDAEHYPARWSNPSVPWTQGQKSVLGHTPGPGASDGTWQLALPAVGRCLQMGWEQRLGKCDKDIKHLNSMNSALFSSAQER